MWCIHEWSKDGEWTFIRTWRKCKCPNRRKQKSRKWWKENEIKFEKCYMRKDYFGNQTIEMH
jgi:Zn ribbon nucleic-acid-binding protein